VVAEGEGIRGVRGMLWDVSEDLRGTMSGGRIPEAVDASQTSRCTAPAVRPRPA